jgi:BirA family biotin operon repressor/biotin-[acetyl-CoA-carboxylase] ligase
LNFIGAHKIKLNVAESTNSSLKDMVKKEDLPEGTLLVADWQTKGKGQMESGWISEKFQNFTGTYLLKPELEINNAFVINLISSLAVKSVIEDFIDGEQSISIKWPNDILVDGKKIAGILVENQVKSNQVSNSFIGIGINVNQITFLSFKREATSISNEIKQVVLIDDLTEKLSIHLQQFYMLFRTKGIQPLLKLYLEALYLNNSWSSFLIPEKTTLMIIGINENGLLVLKNEQNESFTFGIKEIEFIV